jgi:anaerobic magnesium-protoporphyrin IX monomethyl ester cyclase
LLINPISMVQEGYTPPPLGLIHIAAMDPDTVIVDHARNSVSDITTILRQHSPKIVGVPVYTWGRKEALEVLRIAKELGAITVAGGPHVSVMTEQIAEACPFIDFLVVGDGEFAWKAITERMPLPRIIRMRVETLSRLPLPAWNLIDINNYQAWGEGVHRGNDLTRLPRCPIVFGRGCPGSCAFCSAWSVNGFYRYYDQSWMNSLLELLWNRGVRHLGWQDDCLTANMPATRGLCDKLSRYGFSSFGTTRVDCMTEPLAQALADAGFYELSFGIESGSSVILTEMGKKTDLEQAFVTRESCRKAGIKFTALMMDGYPGETDETRKETHDFLKRLRPDKVCSLGRTLVFPGTRLYESYKKLGKVTDSFWLSNEPAFIA